MNTFFDHELIKQRFGFKPVSYAEFLAVNKIVPAELSNDKLKRLCDIKATIEDRQHKYGVLYYRPQDYQLPFHASQKKERAVFGGNQTGKTEIACAETITLSLGIHPFRKMPVPNKGRVVATDIQRGIGEVIMQKYDKLLPKSELAGDPKKYNTGEWKKISYKTGSTVEFMSYEMPSKAFEGWVGDWVYFDEPPPRDIYIACVRGLMRRKGIVIFSMTPLDEPWIYDEIYLKADATVPDAPDVFEFDLDQNRYVSAEEKKKFAEKLDDDEKEARLHGKFKHLSGRIYKEFEPRLHGIKSFEIPKEWPRYCAMDYHPKKPCFVVWVAIDPRGRAYVYDELEADGTILDIAKLIYDKEGTEYKVTGGDKATETPRIAVKKVGDRARMRWIDPLSATPERTGQMITSPQREFLRHGLGFRSATKSWQPGKNAVREYLKPDREGKPFLLFFSDKTPKAVKGHAYYSWDNYNRRDDETDKEKPRKNSFAEPCDCVRYILVHRPTYNAAGEQISEIEQNDPYRNPVTGYSYGSAA